MRVTNRFCAAIWFVACAGRIGAQPATRSWQGEGRIETIISRILRDEAQHAELGWWFLDWAELARDDLAHLAVVAGATIRSFRVLFESEGANAEALGALPCARFDGTFVDSVSRDVVQPLAERGIVVPAEDVAVLRSTAISSRR